MSSRRDALLTATSKAAEFFSRFWIAEHTSFDVVAALGQIGVPILFRPLSKLWGALLSGSDQVVGILVTTVLDLATQRFTIAHELGHLLLGHGTQLDHEVGFSGRFAPRSLPIEERAADTFASELLAPRSLMLGSARRHHWTREAFNDPANVYQLSLRLGVSFQATSWALAAQNVLPLARAKQLHEYRVKDLKLALAPETLITNPWANVWRLTAGDNGSFIEASPDDLFSVELTENASAGFLWELVDAGPHSRIVDDKTELGVRFGDYSTRSLFVRFDKPGVHRLLFEHRRRWNREKLAHIDVRVANYGKEQGGLARRIRERALVAEPV